MANPSPIINNKLWKLKGLKEIKVRKNSINHKHAINAVLSGYASQNVGPTPTVLQHNKWTWEDDYVEGKLSAIDSGHAPKLNKTGHARGGADLAIFESLITYLRIFLTK